jgi:hypothetical protein
MNFRNSARFLLSIGTRRIRAAFHQVGAAWGSRPARRFARVKACAGYLLILKEQIAGLNVLQENAPQTLAGVAGR